MFGSTGSAFGAPAAGGGLFGAKPAGGAFGASTSAFGAPAAGGAFGAKPAGAFGAAPATGGSLFGAASAPAFGQAAASPFGAKPGAFGAAASTSAFGASTSAFGAKPAGGAFGAASTSAFGASTSAFGAKPGGFGAPAGGAFGAAAASSSSLFGGASAFGAKPAAGGLFGAQSASAFGSTGGAFGAKPGAFGGGGMFGAAAAPTASTGLFGAQQARPGFGAQMQQQQQIPSPLADFANAFQNIKNAYDPNSPSNRFRMMLYNVVAPGDAKRYVPNQLTDMTLWNQAKRNNPDPSRLIPVQATGFSDLTLRLSKQDEQTNAHKNALTAIEERLRDIQQRHKLHTLVKAQEYRQKHFEFGQRLLKVMQQLTVLQARGLPLLSEEVSFRQKLAQLQETMVQPNRMKIRELEGLVNIHVDAAPKKSQVNLTPEAANGVFEYLKDQTAAIKHVRGIIEKDERDMRYVTTHLDSPSSSKPLTQA